MKSIASGDKHHGLVSDGIDRLAEQSRIIDQTLGFLEEHEPDVFVDLGDLDDNARPSPEAHALGIRYAVGVSDWRAYNPQKRLAYFLVGNHDKTKRGRNNALEPIRVLGIEDPNFPRVVNIPEMVTFGTHIILLLPFIYAGDINGEDPQEYLDAAANSSLIASKKTGKKILCFAHLEAEGATASKWDSRYRDVGLHVPTVLIDNPAVERIFCGHIHRYQNRGNLTIVGSALHVDFGEATDPKGAILYETSK